MAGTFYTCRKILGEVAILVLLSELQKPGQAFVPRVLDVVRKNDKIESDGET